MRLRLTKPMAFRVLWAKFRTFSADEGVVCFIRAPAVVLHGRCSDGKALTQPRLGHYWLVPFIEVQAMKVSPLADLVAKYEKFRRTRGCLNVRKCNFYGKPLKFTDLAEIRRASRYPARGNTVPSRPFALSLTEGFPAHSKASTSSVRTVFWFTERHCG